MCTQITLVAVCDISSVIMPSVMELLSLVACTSVGGIMVSIAAFQAVDPGSIPGRRSNNFGQIDLEPSAKCSGMP